MGSIATPHPIVEPHLSESSYDVPIASYPQASTAPLPTSSTEIHEIASKCIQNLNSMLAQKNYSHLSSLMTSTSYWRDHLCLSPTKFSTLHGPKEVLALISSTPSPCNITAFSLDPTKVPEITNLDPNGKIKCLQAFLVFETKTGGGRGVVRLLQDVENGNEWKIYTMFTTLCDLKETPFLTGETRPFHAIPHGVPETMNWKEYRERKREFLDEEPVVLIVGAGHSGMMTAARLGMLGVTALVIEKNARTGDVWRERYHDLVLHDPCYMNAMPYLPYPPSWPLLAPKDKIADFLESYESALELNIWNKTQLIESKWDAIKKSWTVVVEREVNGISVRRTLHPRHVVQATGLNGEIRMPQIPGMESFEGKITHSTGFIDASPKYAGRKVIVVGTGTSGHDIAQCCQKHGADVTIIQRSPTFIVSLDTVQKTVAPRYNNRTPHDDSDLLSISTPMTLFKRIGSDAALKLRPNHQHLLDGLRAAGFEIIDDDELLPTFLALTIHRAGGFYIDVGCSGLIASGKIHHKFGQEITQFNKNSVTFADGEEMEADEVIFATGYANGRTRTRKIFGDSVADRIDQIWGFDRQGEIRGVWRRSGHEAFWVAAGSIWLSRYYSRLLALQIKMIEEGLVEV